MSNQRTRGSARPVLVPDPLDVNAQVKVSKNAQAVGTQREINLTPGDGIIIVVSDNAQNNRVDVTIAHDGYARSLLLMGG